MGKHGVGPWGRWSHGDNAVQKHVEKGERLQRSSSSRRFTGSANHIITPHMMDMLWKKEGQLSVCVCIEDNLSKCCAI